MARSCRTVALSECNLLHMSMSTTDRDDSDLIFGVPKLISFLSQGTTLPAGTVILTGTPAGVGVGKKPPQYLRDGDEFAVEILPHIGTMTTVFEAEK